MLRSAASDSEPAGSYPEEFKFKTLTRLNALREARVQNNAWDCLDVNPLDNITTVKVTVAGKQINVTVCW